MVLVSKSPLDIVVLPAPNLMSKVARFSGRPATSQRSLWLHNNKDSAGCSQQSCTAGVEKNLCCALCPAIVRGSIVEQGANCTAIDQRTRHGGAHQGSGR